MLIITVLFALGMQKMSDFLKLARIHNMIPSMLLVVVGAWVRPKTATVET